MKKLLFAMLLSAALVFTLTPMSAFATLNIDGMDIAFWQEVDASGQNAGDQNQPVEIGGYDGSECPVGIVAANSHTATVAVSDDINTSADLGIITQARTGGNISLTVDGTVAANLLPLGLYAGNAKTTYEDNHVEEASAGTISAEVKGTSGQVTIEAVTEGSTATLISNGNLENTSGRALYADAKNGGVTNVEVAGDVIGSNLGIYLECGGSGGNNILVTGTISGSQNGISASYSDSKNSNVTVWKIAGSNPVTYNGYADDTDRENFCKNRVSYIVRSGDNVKPLKADGTALATSHDFPVAKEGEKIQIKSQNGKKVVKAYNGTGENKTEITTTDANGNLVYAVPRGGGVDLSIETSDEMDPDADVTTTVEAIADEDSGDVTRSAGNVTVTNRYFSSSAYGVYADAEDTKTATVTVKDVSVNCNHSDVYWQYGVGAYAGDISSDYTQGHVNVTTGNITSKDSGVEASANDDSDITVTVNGSIKAGAYEGTSGRGVIASSRNGSVTSVTVKGNVEAVGPGLSMDSPEYDGQSIATASVEVNGDVTATDGAGVQFNGKAETQDVLVTGTVSGSTYGVTTDTYYGPSAETDNKLTVWKVTAGSGKAEDLFVKRTDFSEYAADDDSAKAANYIVMAADNVKALKADGTALDQSHDYPVAREGDKILITAAENGKVVTKAYNSGVEITTKDANGCFYYEVPRGGGIDLTADIGDAPAHDPVAIPSGKTFTYNGSEHTGVAAGTGYTLAGTTTAKNAGTYKATAALVDGYVWTDGTTAAKTITWKINKAIVKVTVPKGKTLTYTGKTQAGVAAGNYYTRSGTYSAKKAGSYTAKATLKTATNYTYKWADGTTAAKTIKWKINKAANTLKIKSRIAKVKYSAVKAKNQTLAVSKVISFSSKGQGTKTYQKKSGNKKITIAKKTGKVTVKKGLAKGTYKVKVKVTAAGNANYKAGSKTITFTVKVQ